MTLFCIIYYICSYVNSIPTIVKLIKTIDDIIYIDTYTYLTKNGYSTRDGLHYDNKTYKSIYSYIRKEI